MQSLVIRPRGLMHYVDLGKVKSKSVSNRSFRPRRSKIVVVTVFGVGALLLVCYSLGLVDFLTPISVFSEIVNPQGLASTEGRTNILLLALDRRGGIDPRCGNNGDGSAGLSDTLIVASMDFDDGDAVLISIPRDLWVETGYFSGKINAAYSAGGGSGGGSQLVSRVVGGVLGIPIHYYAAADFSGFEKAIDILGGVEVDIENVLDDYKYPVSGQECAEVESDKWQHIHFDAGLQTMDGVQALKFVRSRHAQGAEGSDFARSRRQQKILLAVRRKILSLSTFSDWDKVKQLWQTFGDSVQTDLDLWEIERLYSLGKELGDGVRMEVLDGQQGLLFAPEDKERFGGAWVLIPRVGDFSGVRAYVNELLFKRTD